ncbi:MAG: acyltransferase family protein [Muribaculaceae bacterium]|nr:acyltransferase family protein [Muribaculaceae bacterium]
MQTTQRDLTLDALKLFAIFMVLYGHTIQYLLSSDYWDEPVYRVIYSFHMPLFMALTGYFSDSLMRLSLKELIMKRGRQLILPAICFGVIFLAIGVRSGGVTAGLDMWFQCFWFLKSAFVCCFLYFIANRIFRRNPWAIVVSLMVSQLISMFQVYLMYPCFLFGLFIHENINLIKRYSGQIALWSGVVFIMSLTIWDASFWQVPKPDELMENMPTQAELSIYLTKNAFRIVLGLVGTLFFVSLFEFAAGRMTFPDKFRIIPKFGGDTLGVYILQTFMLEILLHKMFNFDGYDFYFFNFVIAPGISLAVLIVCLWIVHLIKKSDFLALFLLGRKR